MTSHNNVSQLYKKVWITERNVATQLNFASDHLKRVTGAIDRNSPFRCKTSKARCARGIRAAPIPRYKASQDGSISVDYFIKNNVANI